MTDEIEIDLDVRAWVTKNQKALLYLMLILIVIGGFYSRTRNIPALDSKYLLSPDDPYIFLRYSTSIAETGSIPANDTLRYYPIGHDTSGENTFMAYIAGYSLNAVQLINPNLNMFDIASYLAPILFTLSIVVFFFVSKEILNNGWFALITTGLMAFSNSILMRTSAGFLEKEPLFLLMFLLSMYFFIKAYKSETNKKSILFGSLAGIFTALSAFSSGLTPYLLATLAIFFVVEIALQKVDSKKLMAYLSWIGVCFVTLFAINILCNSMVGFYGQLFFQIPAAISIFGIIAVYAQKISITKKIQSKLGFIPKGIFHILLGSILIAIAGAIVFGPHELIQMITWAINKFVTPLGTSVMATTVSENQTPFFSDWWNAFGLNIKYVGIVGFVLMMFFVGSIALFYKEFKRFKSGIYLTIVFVIFTLSAILEKYSTQPNFINTLFSPHWFYIVLFGVSIIVFLFVEKNSEKFSQINSINLMLIIWYTLALFMTNSATRLIFMMAFPAILCAGYSIKWCYDLIKQYKIKYVEYVLFGFVAVLCVFSFISVYNTNSNLSPQLKYYYDSMDWLKANTPQDAIITHWWDYGYLIQALTNRTTIVDPSNAYQIRNFDVGGHLFNALNSDELLWFTNKYSLTDKDVYLFIPGEDIMKFIQIARLGSLSEGTPDRESYFSVYGINVNNPKESLIPNNLGIYTEYSSIAVLKPLSNYALVMDDFRIDNKVYVGQTTVIANFLLPISGNETGPMLVQIFDTTTQKTEVLPIICLCELKKGCYDINVTGVPTCVLGINGGVINIPYKAKDILFTQLYLLDKDVPGFDKVYDNGLPLDLNTARGAGPLIRIYKYNWVELRG